MQDKSIYKYTKLEYAKNFIEKGEILFRSLYYFQNFYGEKYSQKEIRDEDEGVINIQTPKNYSPTITIQKTGEKIKPIPGSFKWQQGIKYPACHYISCFSTSSNPDLYKKFDANCRIKILNFEEFLKRLRPQIKYFSPSLNVGNVVYTNSIPPHSQNNLSIVFYKGTCFKKQEEFRIYFPDLANIDKGYNLSTNIQKIEIKGFASEILFSIGSLEDIVQLEFPNNYSTL